MDVICIFFTNRTFYFFNCSNNSNNFYFFFINQLFRNFYYLNFYKRDVLNAYPKKVVEDVTPKIVLYEDPQCTIKINEENPLFTYKYELPEIMIETNHGSILSTGFEPADTGLWNSEPGKITEEYFLPNKYYIKENGKYVLANNFNPNDFYYIKKNYEFYYDPMNPDIMYISKESYNRIYEEFKKLYYDIKITYPRVYLNEISIDGSQVELEENNDFEIKTSSIFNEIKIGAGIYLNCGYQFQRVEYLYEKDIFNYQELKILNKILISNYRDYKTVEFNNLLSMVGISSNQSYDKIIAEAQKQYNEKYIEYAEKLTQILKEKEVIEQ